MINKQVVFRNKISKNNTALLRKRKKKFQEFPIFSLLYKKKLYKINFSMLNKSEQSFPFVKS